MIGLIQKITFHDFLPLLLGPEMYNKYIGEYNGYDKNAIPDINTEFSTASYRIGHSLIVNKYPFINRYGEIEQ